MREKWEENVPVCHVFAFVASDGVISWSATCQHPCHTGYPRMRYTSNRRAQTQPCDVIPLEDRSWCWYRQVEGGVTWWVGGWVGLRFEEVLALFESRPISVFVTTKTCQQNSRPTHSQMTTPRPLLCKHPHPNLVFGLVVACGSMWVHVNRRTIVVSPP